MSLRHEIDTPRTQPAPTAFISYTHATPDQDLAKELVAFLEQHDVDVFVDTKIGVGASWIDEIERNLRSMDYFIVLLSLNSIRSDMVRREVAIAHRLRSAKKLKVLPVHIGFEGELPYDLGAYLHGIQYAAWKPGQDFRPICGSILNSIRNPSAPDVEEERLELHQNSAGVQTLAKELGSAPLPSADPRLETGALKPGSPFYIRRPADARVAELLRQPGVTVLIKGPRQVGKTSMLAYAKATAAASGHRTAYLDFQLIDEAHLQSLQSLLHYFSHRLALELQTSLTPRNTWDEALGAPESLTYFVEQAILEPATTPVTLCLDEVDRLFAYPFRNGFFGMLRAWHNRRATNPLWGAFNLLIGHSTEPVLFIDDINQSPFNVGEVLRLADFDITKVRELNRIYGAPLHSDSDVHELMTLVGGHPFLVRQALYSLRTTVQKIRELTKVATDADGPFGDHLRRYLWLLRDKPAIREELLRVLQGGRCSDEMVFQRLSAAGLVSGTTRENAVSRCDLYRRYFGKHL